MEVYTEALYDDFTGFTFNGKHSSEFGLLRVSDGDRYEDNFVPSLNDETADVPGGAGKYYYGETIKERKFSLNMAYDNIGEKDKKRIKHWLHSDDKLHELIFDEKPYIKYWVKCSKEVVTNELCFNELDSNGKERRVYKGDFKIDFIAYMPYGLAIHKDLEEFNPDNSMAATPRNNFSEWADSSGLLSLINYNLNKFTSNQANIYNGGDIETGFELIFDLSAKHSILKYQYKNLNTAQSYTVYSNKMEAFEENKYIFINEKAEKIIDNDFPKVKAGNMEGQIIVQNNISKFESLTNGIIYDIFKPEPVNSFNYRVENNLGLIANGKYFAIEGNKAYEIYITKIENSIATVTFPKGEVPSSYILQTLLIAPSTNSSCSFGLKENSASKSFTEGYSFELTVMAAALINPEDWTETQKALFYGGQIKIDTNKKLVSYRRYIESTETWDEWQGLVSIITRGNLFKIPSDALKPSEEIELNNFRVFSIEYTNPISMTIENPTISYEYLYI